MNHPRNLSLKAWWSYSETNDKRLFVASLVCFHSRGPVIVANLTLTPAFAFRCYQPLITNCNRIPVLWCEFRIAPPFVSVVRFAFPSPQMCVPHFFIKPGNTTQSKQKTLWFQTIESSLNFILLRFVHIRFNEFHNNMFSKRSSSYECLEIGPTLIHFCSEMSRNFHCWIWLTFCVCWTRII